MSSVEHLCCLRNLRKCILLTDRTGQMYPTLKRTNSERKAWKKFKIKFLIIPIINTNYCKFQMCSRLVEKWHGTMPIEVSIGVDPTYLMEDKICQSPTHI